MAGHPDGDRPAPWTATLPARGGVATFVGGVLAFVALGILVRQPEVPAIDERASAWLHGLASPTLDTIMGLVTSVGSILALALIAGVVALVCLALGQRAAAGFLLVVLVGSVLLNEVLKALVGRARPDLPWSEVPAGFSFPSGHAMNTTAVMLGIAIVIWRLWGGRAGMAALIAASVLAAAVAVTRVYLGAHWLTDVVAGLLAGALWVLLVLVAARVHPWRR